VRAALVFLVLLIGSVPAVLFADGSLALAMWSALVAVGLLVVARTLRPGEGSHFVSVVRPLVILAVLPALLVAVQAIPLPAIFRANNSMWESAEAALGQPLTGSISIDTGATIISLCRYLAWLGVALLACAVTIDRQRAERVLFLATAICVLIALLLIINDASGALWLDQDRDPGSRGAALDIAILGLVLSMAGAVRAYERFETHRAEQGQSARLIRNITLSVICFAVCTVALAFGDPGNALFAGGAGFATMVSFVLVRRLGAGLGGALAIPVIGCMIAIGTVTHNLSATNPDFTIAFAGRWDAANAIAQRILADGTLLGTGAGTYRDLVPIYRGVGDITISSAPPSTAAQVAIEFGRPLFWGGVAAIVMMIAMFLRAGFRRGRDSFYAGAAASTLVALLVAAFGNPGIFGSSVVILLGAILGLAVAQSRSRTA